MDGDVGGVEPPGLAAALRVVEGEGQRSDRAACRGDLGRRVERRRERQQAADVRVVRDRGKVVEDEAAAERVRIHERDGGGEKSNGDRAAHALPQRTTAIRSV